MATRKSTPKNTSKTADLKKLAAKQARQAEGLEVDAYTARVRELEAEGLTTSDAQAAAEAEGLQPGSTIATADGTVIAEQRHVEAKAPAKAEELTVKLTYRGRLIAIERLPKKGTKHQAEARAAVEALPERGGKVTISLGAASVLDGIYTAAAVELAEGKSSHGPAEAKLRLAACRKATARITAAIRGERAPKAAEILGKGEGRKAGKPAAQAGSGRQSAKKGKTVKVAVEGGGEVEVAAELVGE